MYLTLGAPTNIQGWWRVSTEQCRGDETFPFYLLRRKNNKLRKRQKGPAQEARIFGSRSGLVVPRILSCFDVFVSLRLKVPVPEAVERETRRERRWREVQSRSLFKESRLVNYVLESTVSTDWMAALLSAPGVVSCSLGYYALVSAVDLIHLFSLILPSQMFVPLQFSWFASWKFVNFTRNFGWRCYFLFFTVLAWDKL